MLWIHAPGASSRLIGDWTAGTFWQGPHTDIGYQLRWLGMEVGQTGPSDRLASGLLLGQFQVYPEQERQRVFALLHAVGGADGGVEGGLAVAAAVGVGRFEGAIEVAQGSAVGCDDLAVQDLEHGPSGSRDGGPECGGAT